MILAVGSFWKVFTAALFLLTCVLLIVVVLLQRGRGGGLSGAFGGGGGYSPFGAKTGDFFTWLTVGLAGLFLILAIIANFAFRKVEVDAGADQQRAPLKVPAPAQGGAGGPVGEQPIPAGTPSETPAGTGTALPLEGAPTPAPAEGESPGQ